MHPGCSKPAWSWTAAGFAITRSIESLLLAVSSTDPGTDLAVALVLSAVVALGSPVPAWRATRVDPIRAVRVQ